MLGVLILLLPFVANKGERAPQRRPWAVAVVLIAWVISMIAVERVGRRDQAQRADAIVVLGAAQYVGRPSPVLRARVDHAVSLWKRGLAPTLILTGGTGVGDTTSEAAVARKYAMSQGVPDRVIVIEIKGRTTSESMRAVARSNGSKARSRSFVSPRTNRTASSQRDRTLP